MTTIDVSGVTKLYFRERSRASAVAFSLSSGEHFSLATNFYWILYYFCHSQVIGEFFNGKWFMLTFYSRAVGWSDMPTVAL